MRPSQPPSGRYRCQGEQRLDPDEGVHPEMVEPTISRPEGSGCSDASGGSVPTSPSELIAMQQNPDRPRTAGRPESAKVQQVLDLLGSLDARPREEQQIALSIVTVLECHHDEVAAELLMDHEASRGQLARWAIDADRLMHCLRQLESVELD